MERYLIQQSDAPNYWVCTDQENGLVCKFEQGNYNDNQEFTFLEDVSLNPLAVASLSREMADWLFENHYEKLV